jgi:hypothetical protein
MFPNDFRLLFDLQVTHGIKLYPPGAPANMSPTDTETPVLAETYEEVVFTDPTELFFKQLQAVREAPTVESEYTQHAHFGKFSDTDDVQALLEAQKFLRQQLRTAKERLNNVAEDMVKVEQDMLILQQSQQQQQQRAAASGSGGGGKGNSPNKGTKHKSSTGGAKGSAAKKAKQK